MEGGNLHVQVEFVPYAQDPAAVGKPRRAHWSETLLVELRRINNAQAQSLRFVGQPTHISNRSIVNEGSRMHRRDIRGQLRFPNATM